MKIFAKVGLVSIAALIALTPGKSVARDVSRNTDAFASVAEARTGGQDNIAMNVYLTGYSYWDNTPPGSAAISKPVIHKHAGGTGTYHDPVTLAVGHVIKGKRQTLDYPAGTRFYIEQLQKYAIVEDVCGDGHRPQDGPCHTGHKGLPWLDIYIGGKSADAGTTEQCARLITGIQRVILNPQSGFPVNKGEITKSVCLTS